MSFNPYQPPKFVERPPEKEIINYVFISSSDEAYDHVEIPEGATHVCVERDFDNGVVGMEFLKKESRENPDYETQLEYYTLNKADFEVALQIWNDEKEKYDREQQQKLEIKERAELERLKAKYES